MILPVGDDITTERKPILTLSLIITNIVVFGLCLYYNVLGKVIYSYGLKPKEILAGVGLHTLFTHMFLHSSYLHIIGNMLYLWVFGDNIEDFCGRVRFVILYFVAGLSAALAYILVSPSALIPGVGASGAISGILGACFVTFYYARVKIVDPLLSFLPLIGFLFSLLLPLFFCATFFLIFAALAVLSVVARRKVTWEVSAVWLILFWFVFQALCAFIYGSLGVPPITYLAHVAGFVLGFFSIHFLQIRKEIPEKRWFALAPKPVTGIYRPKELLEIKTALQTRKIRCKTCGTEFEVAITGRSVTVKCPSCGSKGKIKVS